MTLKKEEEFIVRLRSRFLCCQSSLLPTRRVTWQHKERLRMRLYPITGCRHFLQGILFRQTVNMYSFMPPSVFVLTGFTLLSIKVPSTTVCDMDRYFQNLGESLYQSQHSVESISLLYDQLSCDVISRMAICQVSTFISWTWWSLFSSFKSSLSLHRDTTKPNDNI